MYTHNHSYRLVLLYWSGVRQTKHLKCLSCCCISVAFRVLLLQTDEGVPWNQQFFCFVNLCAASFVCSQTATVFPSLTLLSIYIPHSLYSVLFLPCCPPHPTEIFPPPLTHHPHDHIICPKPELYNYNGVLSQKCPYVTPLSHTTVRQRLIFFYFGYNWRVLFQFPVENNSLENQ